MLEKLYTTKEAAELMGVSTRTIFRYMQPDYSPQLKAVKIGRAWRIKETDLKEFIEQSKNYK